MRNKQQRLITRLFNQVFPRMPDFFGLLNEQCDLAVVAQSTLVEFMKDDDRQTAQRVRDLEHEGDRLKLRNMDILNRSFSTPMDREDIYRAIVGVDHVVNYAKTTVREIEVLRVTPDQHMEEMAVLLYQGTDSLREGYRTLRKRPLEAEPNAQAARKAERSIEKVYRRAIAELFDDNTFAQMLQEGGQAAMVNAMLAMVQMQKRREVYRHLSNAADRLAHAGDVLHDIVVKIS